MLLTKLLFFNFWDWSYPIWYPIVGCLSYIWCNILWFCHWWMKYCSIQKAEKRKSYLCCCYVSLLRGVFLKIHPLKWMVATRMYKYRIRTYHRVFFACSMYKKIPPATETLSDSYSPAIAMLTSSHACMDFSERPLPSLPKTKHNGVSDMDSQKLGESKQTGLTNPSDSGCPASNFIWNSFFRDSRWFQLPETKGSWKEAPRLARRAFSLNGSQHPGRRKTPSCWAIAISSCFQIKIHI